VIGLYRAAKERGKYEAIGGHKARPSGVLDPEGRMRCSECNRPLTYREDRHYTKPRRRR